MKVHIGVPGQASILFEFVSFEVVQYDVDLATAVLGYDIVHEIQKLSSPVSRIMTYLDLTGGDFQGGQQSTGAMPFVAVAESVQGLATRQSQPSLCPLKNLYVRLFVNAQHHRIFRRT